MSECVEEGVQQPVWQRPVLEVMLAADTANSTGAVGDGSLGLS